MTVRRIRKILGWCTLVNVCLLTAWFLVFTLAHEWMFLLHSRWFHLSLETFDGISYGGMALFKIGIWLFNLTPYLTLHIAAREV